MQFRSNIPTKYSKPTELGITTISLNFVVISENFAFVLLHFCYLFNVILFLKLWEYSTKMHVAPLNLFFLFYMLFDVGVYIKNA